MGWKRLFADRQTPTAVAALLAIALLILTPSLVTGPGPTDAQIYNYVWTTQIADAFLRGEIYPRWLPSSFEGLGSPTFFYYPPFVHFIAGALDALGLTTLQAINGAAFAVLFASGLAMYCWLRWRGTRPLLGASLYMAAPYHLIDFYLRGALAEFAAFLWLPLIAWGIEALPKRWAVALLATAFGGLAMTHLTMTIVAVTFLILPLGLRKVWTDRSVLLPGLAAGLLGVGLAAIYLLPALTLLDYTNSAILWAPGFRPERWYFWHWQGLDGFVTKLPIIAIAAALLALPSRSIWTLIVLASGLAAFGVLPIWGFSPLDKVQFPWRVMAIVEFAAVTALVTTPPSRIAAATAGALLLVPLGSVVVTAVTAPSQNNPAAYAQLRLEMPDAREYLPRGVSQFGLSLTQRRAALAPYRALRPALPYVDVDSPGHVTVKRATYPIWRVFKDGREVTTSGPAINFEAVPGRYELRRIILWQERAGALASLLAVGVIAHLLVARGYIRGFIRSRFHR